ncbi:hypothetical protein FG386_003491 [Cryptosporidium ryanae]|uniref:uncharacterized protein n=1 Tax=Cryptosporidium ryanae TaxID=515981 RepID=UPI003519E425|nr:hypothetical protein FG386_003491 [Cryptosporidium ryanae]
MRYSVSCAIFVVLLLLLSTILSSNAVRCAESVDFNGKIAETDDKASTVSCQWRLFYEFSLMSTSRVKLLPVEKPKSFQGGENKDDLFKSCFRGIRELLRKQWRSYEGMMHYRNSDLKENLIRIGKERLISAPKTKEQGRSIFENVKYFCIYVTNRYFELLREANDITKLLNGLCSKPIRKKMTRVMLPKDVRFRGESILSELEESDQKRIEEEEKSREDLERQKRGELVPKEGVIPIHETLERHSKNNSLLEISQYIENKSFYENWLNRDKVLASKIKNFPNANEGMLLRRMFGVTEGGNGNTYSYLRSVNDSISSDLNFTLPENWERIQNETLELGHHSKGENVAYVQKYGITPEQKKMMNRNTDRVKKDASASGDQFDILKSEEKELGLELLKDQKKARNFVVPEKPSTSMFYYKTSRNPYTGDLDGEIEKIPFFPNYGNQAKVKNRYFYKLGPGGELNVRNPDVLVPLDEVYELPTIFSDDFQPKNLTGIGGAPLGPFGFDQFGLLNIPSKERTKKELETRIYSTKNKLIDGDKKTKKPLDIEYPINSRVFYINTAGLKKELLGYNLNPEMGRLEKEIKTLNENNELNEILKDFLKSIEAKKKRRLIYNPRSGIIKGKINKRANVLYNPTIPGDNLRMRNTEFASLKDINMEKDFINKKETSSIEDQDYEEKEKEKRSKVPYIAPKTVSFKSTGFKEYRDKDGDDTEDSDEENEDDCDQYKSRRMVRFQIPESECKTGKKYVSPPPNPISEGSESDYSDE